MHGLNERFVDRCSYRLCVRHGPLSNKPLLLFLHGYPDSQRVWQETMLTLADRFCVASVDWPGVAGSGPPVRSARYRIEALIQDIESVVTELGYEQVHLVGHDWGSTIGQRSDAGRAARAGAVDGGWPGRAVPG